MMRAYALPPAMISLGRSAPGLLAHHVVVDPAGGGVDAVVHRAPDLPLWLTAAPCERCPPCGSAMPMIVSPGWMTRHEGGEVGLRARVRLHVGVVGAEELLQPVDGELLDLVDDLAAAVIPPPRISLGVLVGERACPWHR